MQRWHAEHRPRWWWLAAVLLAVLLLAGGLRPVGYTVDAGAPGDWLHVRGFFAPEQSDTGTTFRWSGIESQIWLASPRAVPLLVRLRLNGDRLQAQPDPTLTLTLPDQTALPITPAAGWRTYAVLVPAHPLPAPLTLSIAPYCPADQDNRVLGVPLDLVQVQPLAGLGLAGVLLLVLLLGGLALLAHLSRWAVPVLLAGGGLAALIWLLPQVAAWVLLAGLAGVLIGLAGMLVWSRWIRIGAATRSRWLRRVGLLLAVGLPPLLLPLPLPADVRGLLAWAVLLLPGVLVGLWLVREVGDAWLRLVLALCGGLSLVVLLVLALQSLPGAPAPGLLLLTCVLLSGGMALLHATAPPPVCPATPATDVRITLALLLILALAGGLRLPWLGSAEFQGDEARAMLLAMAVQHGQEGVLLLHRKGPVEALLPAAPLILTGQISELVARLPFALAGIGVVLLGYVLAAWLWRDGRGRAVGLLAALILALDGFLIGFSRIVQYQSMVLLMSGAAVLCGLLFAAGGLAPRRTLSMAAALLAVALLAHYDGIYVVPVLLLLVLRGGWQQGWRSVAAWRRNLGLPMGIGAGLLAAFYMPFVLHEQFRRTIGYLSGRVAEDGAPAESGLLFNTLSDYIQRATFYNTTYQVGVVVLTLVLAVVVWLWRGLHPRWLAVLLIGGWLAGVAGALTGMLPPLLGAVLVVVPLLALLLARALPYALRVSLLWFVVPFAAHSFIISDPRTHFYTIALPTALLTGYAGVQAWQASAGRGAGLRLPLVVSGAVVVLLAVPYLWLVFIQQMPEYQREFPAHRPPIYRAGYGDQLPGGGEFGFPHRDGWKAIGLLYEQGMLQGSYTTNQRDRIAGWYTRGAFTCALQPDYYLLATWQSARLPAEYRADYTQRGCVLVESMRLLSIYGRNDDDASLGSPVLRLEAARAVFDQQPLPHFALHDALLAPAPMHPLDVRWDGDLALRGYDLSRATAGGQLAVALYWQPRTPVPASTSLHLRLLDAAGGEVAGFVPLCEPLPPMAWLPDQVSRTQYVAALPADPPAGSYRLEIRLRDDVRGVWLPLRNGADAVRVAVE